MGELGYFFYDNQIGFSQLYNLVRIFARMDHLIEIVALHTIKFYIWYLKFNLALSERILIEIPALHANKFNLAVSNTTSNAKIITLSYFD